MPLLKVIILDEYLLLRDQLLWVPAHGSTHISN